MHSIVIDANGLRKEVGATYVLQPGERMHTSMSMRDAAPGGSITIRDSQPLQDAAIAALERISS